MKIVIGTVVFIWVLGLGLLWWAAKTAPSAEELWPKNPELW